MNEAETDAWWHNADEYGNEDDIHIQEIHGDAAIQTSSDTTNHAVED